LCQPILGQVELPLFRQHTSPLPAIFLLSSFLKKTDESLFF
jgi:hypothetical protein